MDKLVALSVCAETIREHNWSGRERSSLTMIMTGECHSSAWIWINRVRILKWKAEHRVTLSMRKSTSQSLRSHFTASSQPVRSHFAGHFAGSRKISRKHFQQWKWNSFMRLEWWFDFFLLAHTIFQFFFRFSYELWWGLLMQSKQLGTRRSVCGEGLRTFREHFERVLGCFMLHKGNMRNLHSNGQWLLE